MNEKKSNLKNKRVLLITSVLFNYQDLIKAQIEKEGAIVHWYDGRNEPSSVEKILIRIARPLMVPSIYAYYCSVAEKEKSFDPDYIFFISPEALTGKSLLKLKEAFPRAKMILYMWDSIENKHIKHTLGYFDELFSFDTNDCKKFGMKHRPLFYAKDFRQGDENIDYKYDVSFIGTVHSDRAEILYSIKAYCDKNNLSYYFYLFIPGRFLLLLRRLFTKGVRKWDSTFVHTEPMVREKVVEITSSTRCVIDINHPNQTGLTMRTIEMLGLKKKLLTTNVHIKEYDFYRPENQIAVDRKSVKVNKEMLCEQYTEIPEEIYKKYSLKMWVREIFSLCEE